ncbi:MAG: thiamine pyrophosphate-binding protein [Desulfatibacillum sp.]|nr:thiamine pyrophosphate-binding protein [Desulfatibacillum sp.]
MKTLSGSQILARSIAGAGIGYVFTVPTPRLKPVLDCLEKIQGMTVITARDETAAALMADGYIRRSRLFAAVLTDAHGRSLSQVSGVTNAWADKIPLVSVSLCEDAAPNANKGIARSRYDANRVFEPVTVWRKRLSGLADMPKAFVDAVAASQGNRRGPVHLDLEAGLLDRRIEEGIPGIPPEGPVEPQKLTPMRLSGDSQTVDQAVKLLKQARKPLIITGGGVKASRASLDVVRFMERFGLPGCTTMAGIGTIPSDHAYCLGGPSYTAGEAFHVAIKKADVILALGCSFSGLEGFGLPPLWSERIKFIHIDNNPNQIGLNVNPEIPILGDVKTVLAQMAEILDATAFVAPDGWAHWRMILADLKRQRKTRLLNFANRPWGGLHQGSVALEMGKIVEKDNLIMVIDGGNTPLYAAMYGPGMSPRQSFFPFGMAALGGGVPYAIGVALAAPHKRVMLITGDGSSMYAISELETMKRLNLPITIVVNNDSSWNMIKALQDSLFEGNYVGTCLPDIDYAKIAAGFGLYSERVKNAHELVPAYERAVESGGPALIDCVTDCKNLPDSLLSFAMVEFEGAQINPVKLAKSLWKGRDMGLSRALHQVTYVRKALLGFNPSTKRRV